MLIGHDSLGTPIWVLDGDAAVEAVENAKNAYIVGSNGIFLKRRNGFVSSITSVDRVPVLRPVKTGATLHASKLTALQYATTFNFFKAVHRSKKGGEALVTLHYNPNSGQWRLHAPSQEVTPSHVSADYSERFTDFYLVGTIHSHGSMGAFHSSTDHDDEVDFDGLHLVFGNIEDRYPSITGVMAVKGTRFKIDPVDWFEGVAEKKVTRKSYVHKYPQSLGGNSRKTGVTVDPKFAGSLFPEKGTKPEVSVPGGLATWQGPAKRSQVKVFETRYRVQLPQGVRLSTVPVPTGWLENVHTPVSPSHFELPYAYMTEDEKSGVYVGYGEHGEENE